MKSFASFAVPATAVVLMAATTVARAAEKASNGVGVVRDYSAESRSFSIQEDDGRTLRFVWTRETKFNGVVSNGARVSVRYTEQTDGKNLAQTVGVLK